MDPPFLSGQSGTVAGIRATARAAAADLVLDLRRLARREPARLARAAAASPRRRVIVLGVERTDRPNLMAAARTELGRSHHDVEVHVAPVGTRGKWENLNALLAEHPATGHDWLVLLDDDVALPRGFLDALVFLAERFGLVLAQPAHRRRSHAAWPVTRRRAGTVARETGMVEIGPVVALHRTTFATLLPFPPLRAGWGLDAHWAALAERKGWRIGVLDAVPVLHALRPVAAAYGSESAVSEAVDFLASRPSLPRERLNVTRVAHANW